MKKHHLIISGTGRSGTSLLVKFLSACGLESNLTVNKDNAYWNNAAKAGIENNILLDENLPYILKAPWHAMNIAQALATRDIVIDAVLLPMRDLVKAASSRVVLELRNRYEQSPKLLDMPRVDAFGYTAGGCIYSLNPIDQAKEAALGFHELLLEIVKLEIPAVFLEFPRFANDFDYLYKNISFLLPPDTSRQDAEAAFHSLIDQDALRMENEMRYNPSRSVEPPSPTKGTVFPSLEELDNIALRRLAKEAITYKTRLAEAEARLAGMLSSLSWRCTTPLRRVKQKLKILLSPGRRS